MIECPKGGTTMNKTLFFDIDGTLIDCNQDIYEITPRTIVSLDELKRRGHDVILATGRTMCFIVEGVKKYPFSGYVTCNGGYVEYQGKEVFKAKIPQEAILKTHEYCKKHDLTYYFEGRDTIYVLDKHHPVHKEFQERWQMDPSVVKDTYDFNDIEVYIGMIVVNHKSEVPDMIQALSPYFDIQRHQSEYSFDLTLKGISKGLGILKLVEYLHRDMKDTIAFGDGRNDVEMLEMVGLGIAMKNSMPEALAAANYITDSVEKEGITTALQHFNLINK